MMRKKIYPYMLVTLQLGSLFYLLISGPIVASEWVGLLIEIFGIFFGLASIYVAGIHNVNITPTPKIGGKLITSGPYANIRHPMYLAQVLVVIPLVEDKPTAIRLAILSLLIIALVFKMFYEEKGLIRQFGHAYIKYKKNSYRVLPWIF